MKKIILLITLTLNAILFAQNNNQETLSKFIITDASDNGNDITETILEQNGYLVFYTDAEKNLLS